MNNENPDNGNPDNSDDNPDDNPVSDNSDDGAAEDGDTAEETSAASPTSSTPAATSSASSAVSTMATSPKKSWYKRPWGIVVLSIVGLFVVIGVLGSIFGEQEDDGNEDFAISTDADDDADGADGDDADRRDRDSDRRDDAASDDAVATPTTIRRTTTTTAPAPRGPASEITRDGLYWVGADLMPGTYIAEGGGTSCYYEVLSDVSGSFDSILTNHFGNAFGQRVTLQTGQYFDTGDCGGWQLESQRGPQGSPQGSLTRDGMYLVGTDIAAGSWAATGDGTSCYYEVLSDASGSFGSIITNHFGNAFGQRVTLQAGQYFDTGDCGGWQLENQRTSPSTPQTSITRDGQYLVGTDISPGRWAATGDRTDCYFEVLSDASGSFGSIITNHFGNAFGQRVTLQSGQYFDTADCGNWRLEAR